MENQADSGQGGQQTPDGVFTTPPDWNHGAAPPVATPPPFPAPAPTTCGSCGTELGGARFCGNCGTPASADVVLSAPVAAEGAKAGGNTTTVIVSVLVVLAVLVVGAVAFKIVKSGGSPFDAVGDVVAPTEYKITGSMTVIDDDNYGSDPCYTATGYNDVSAGVQVTVKDGANAILGTGELSSGKDNVLGCKFSFNIDKLPKTDWYQVTIGSGRRGEQRYSFDEMVKMNWAVDLTLGL